MSIRIQPGPPGSLGMSHYGIGGTSPPHASASPPAPGFGAGYTQQPYTHNQPPQMQMQMQGQYPPQFHQPQQQQQQYGYMPGQLQQRQQQPFPSQVPYNGQYGSPQQIAYYQQPQQTTPNQAPQPMMVRPAPQQQTYNGSASVPSLVSASIAAVSPPSSGPAGAPRVAFTDPVASPRKPPATTSLAKGESATGVIQTDAKLMARLKVLEDLAPDTKITRFILNSSALMIDMFKLAMASMLAIFVPQLCPPNESATGGPSNCTHSLVPHDCTFEENFRCLTKFNSFVLTWNFLCLAALLLHYRLVWKRESFMIENFKETLTQGRLHLKDIIAEYPTLQIQLHKYNRAVFNTSVFVVFLQVVNVLASGYLTLVQFNDGYKTYTTFFTNCILITIVLMTCLSASWVGLKHELAHSCIGIEPVSYNAMRGHNNIKGQ